MKLLITIGVIIGLLFCIFLFLIYNNQKEMEKHIAEIAEQLQIDIIKITK